MNPKEFVSPSEYEILCPYCFNRFSAHAVLFIDYKDMGKRRYAGLDNYYREFFGLEKAPGEKFPYLFEKMANDETPSPFTAKTLSGDISYYRACPNCNNLLPAAAGKMKTVSIAITGSSKKEKDMHITAMLHKLNKRMVHNFDAAFIPADYTTADLFYRDYEKPLYADKMIPKAQVTVVPLLYEYKNLNSDVPESRTKGNKPIYNSSLVMLYNIDREAFEKHTGLFSNIVSNCDAYLLLSDTPEYGFLFDGSGSLYDPWFGFLVGALRAVGGFDRIRKPSAIVLDRIDKLSVSNKKWKNVLKNANSIDHIEKGFPLSFFSRSSKAIKKALKNEFPEYYSAVDTLFGGVTSMCFALNAFYEEENDDIIENGYNNAADIPLLWLFSRLGIIPENGGKTIIRK